MSDSGCADVRQWLRQAVLADDPTPPTLRIETHIAACALCRGAVALLAAEAIGLASALQNITCQRAGEQLALLIEQESTEGSAAAIRTYPLIWWHICSCATCAEAYLHTRSLLVTGPVSNSVANWYQYMDQSIRW